MYVKAFKAPLVLGQRERAEGLPKPTGAASEWVKLSATVEGVRRTTNPSPRAANSTMIGAEIAKGVPSPLDDPGNGQPILKRDAFGKPPDGAMRSAHASCAHMTLAK